VSARKGKVQRGVSLTETAPVDEIDVRAVQAHLGFKLRMAQVAVFRNFLRAFKPFDLRPGHYSALKLIAVNPGMRQQRLGETLEIKRPNLVLLVADLERRGWIERRRSRSDMRSYALHLTAEGEALVRTADEAHEAHEAQLRGILGKDVERFSKALDRICAELGKGE
jgi:DNA-binding MarR family transcriptional regulator